VAQKWALQPVSAIRVGKLDGERLKEEIVVEIVEAFAICVLKSFLLILSIVAPPRQLPF
jgi:hypothetical protein